VSARGQSIAPFEVVVMVASAGGLATVGEVLESLPAGFPASVVVVQHRSPDHDHYVELWGGRCRLPVRPVAGGGVPLPGHVYVAPACGRVVFDEARRFSITTGETGGGDALLASAAARFGHRCIGVVLTGRGHDGAMGVRAVKSVHGRVLVQDGDAAWPSMPLSAVSTGCADFVLPVRVIGRALTALAMAPGGAELFRVRAPAWARPA
jgi:two-component system chemotaxis response regulator CheB